MALTDRDVEIDVVKDRAPALAKTKNSAFFAAAEHTEAKNACAANFFCKSGLSQIFMLTFFGVALTLCIYLFTATKSTSPPAPHAHDWGPHPNDDHELAAHLVMADPVCQGAHRYFCLNIMTTFRDLHRDFREVSNEQDISDPEHPLAQSIKNGKFTKALNFAKEEMSDGIISAVIHHGNGIYEENGDIIDSRFTYDQISDSYGMHEEHCLEMHVGHGKLCFAHGETTSNTSNGTFAFALHYDRRPPHEEGRELVFSCVAAIIGGAVSAFAASSTGAAVIAGATAVGKAAAVGAAMYVGEKGAEYAHKHLLKGDKKKKGGKGGKNEKKGGRMLFNDPTPEWAILSEDW